MIAFTTLQARLFFPVGSLLGVGLEVQTSLALFDRVFEYLDQPVDIEEGTRTLEPPARRRRLRGRLVPLRGRPLDAARTSRSRCPRGSKTALVGETGSGKTTAGYLVARLYDVTRGTVSIDGVDVRELTFESLADAVGVVCQETYLFHATVRDNLRFARPDADRRGGRGGGAGGADPRPDRRPPRRLRHRRRRARLPLLGRRAAADRDRADDPAQPADPRPRRGDLGARHADRARRPGGARAARRGPDDDRDRAPALDRPRRRPDRRARPRPRRRDRHARGAALRGRPLRRARLPRHRRGADLAERVEQELVRERRAPCCRCGRSSSPTASIAFRIDSSTASITAS